MVDEGHLTLLKQGVTVWNQWWKNHPRVTPELEGINLKEANLREINFCRADLREATFSRVDLSMANLEGANLRIAMLE